MKNLQSIKISQIQLPNYCFKLPDEEKLAVLKTVIKKNGQLQPIQVRKLYKDRYEIIAGRNVFRCMAELDYQEIICYNHEELSDLEAERIALELDLQQFKIDLVGLAQIIEDQVEEYGVESVASTLPFSVDEVIDYTQLLHFDFDAPLIEMENRRKNKKSKFKSKFKSRTPESSNQTFTAKDVAAIMKEFIKS